MYQKMWVGIGILILSVFSCGILAYAGNINAAEQTVIDYYNKTFTYEGKKYVASEAAKQSVYNKMMQDDVDLTSVEAKTAIRQASLNVKKGIDEGYLVEVQENGTTETPSEPSTEGSTETGAQEPGGDDKTGDTENGDTETGEVPGETTPGNNLPNEGGKGGDGSNKSTNPDKRPDVNVKELIGQTGQEGDEHGFIYMPENTTDLLNLNQPITAEQYLSAKLTVVSADGKLVFQSQLPIKNTGYFQGHVWIYAGAFLAVLFTASILGIKCREKMA